MRSNRLARVVQLSRKAIRELTRIVAPGGRLYFSAPIGREAFEHSQNACGLFEFTRA